MCVFNQYMGLHYDIKELNESVVSYKKTLYSPDIGDRLVREGVVVSGAWVVVVDVVVVEGIHVVKFCTKNKIKKLY